MAIAPRPLALVSLPKAMASTADASELFPILQAWLAVALAAVPMAVDRLPHALASVPMAMAENFLVTSLVT